MLSCAWKLIQLKIRIVHCVTCRAPFQVTSRANIKWKRSQGKPNKPSALIRILQIRYYRTHLDFSCTFLQNTRCAQKYAMKRKNTTATCYRLLSAYSECLILKIAGVVRCSSIRLPSSVHMRVTSLFAVWLQGILTVLEPRNCERHGAINTPLASNHCWSKMCSRSVWSLKTNTNSLCPLEVP